MLKVGLTGSIAVGKSQVLRVFAANGCRVLDADRVARQVVERGSGGLSRIVEEFGEGILDASGGLDRKKMGGIVFADPEKRQLLNSIVHPLVIEFQDKWIAETEEEEPEAIAVIDAALMIESGGYTRFDKLIVAWCEPEIQLQRLMKRDGIDEADARKRIGAQMSQEEKKVYADFLIDTSGSFEETDRRTLKVLSQLRSAANE